MLYFKKEFRSFNTENLVSVGQRASKLPAVKVGGRKKKSADWPRPLSNQSARIRVVPGSNHSQSFFLFSFVTEFTLTEVMPCAFLDGRLWQSTQ